MDQPALRDPDSTILEAAFTNMKRLRREYSDRQDLQHFWRMINAKGV
jgi:hypothetical protein